MAIAAKWGLVQGEAAHWQSIGVAVVKCVQFGLIFVFLTREAYHKETAVPVSGGSRWRSLASGIRSKARQRIGS